MKMKSKIKNAFLKITTTVMAVVLFLSVCLMDSESNIPMIAGIISLAWISLIAWAND